MHPSHHRHFISLTHSHCFSPNPQPPALPFEFLRVPILVATANPVRSEAPCALLPHPSVPPSSRPGDSDTKQESKTTSSNSLTALHHHRSSHGRPAQVRRPQARVRLPARRAHGLVALCLVGPAHDAHARALRRLLLPLLRQAVPDAHARRLPLVRANPSWASLLAVVFRQQVQPWHPSSTLLHESALAVLRLDPAKFWEYSAALFDAQKDFFDVNVVNEPRNQTYRRLAKLAAQSVGLDEAKVYALLEVPDRPAQDGSLNVGNQVTNDLKLLTKMNRLVGVHVTPTVVFDGVVHDTSSSWSVDQWKEWLDKNVV
ncbi:hypothetical protein ACCO45_006567 [Purpureocillium lilacinum]|uniref:Uncharacterized protein n=1 Tax=Purpureocillium lilacinum TaxID=33203 RepID=A0ACC4DPU6_PURLI